jgi:hypothetical protein
LELDVPAFKRLHFGSYFNDLRIEFEVKWGLNAD